MLIKHLYFMIVVNDYLLIALYTLNKKNHYFGF